MNVIITQTLLKKAAVEILEEMMLLPDKKVDKNSSCAHLFFTWFWLSGLCRVSTAQQVVLVQNVLKMSLSKVSVPLSASVVALFSPPLLFATWTPMLCF